VFIQNPKKNLLAVLDVSVRRINAERSAETAPHNGFIGELAFCSGLSRKVV
jgi:hypothetical protein